MSSTQVHLYFRAEGLKDMDTLSKSDPYVVLLDGAGRCTVGRTETRRNDLCPTFEKSILVDYIFETKQTFVVKVLDDDGKGVAGDDVLGGTEFQLAHVVGSRG